MQRSLLYYRGFTIVELLIVIVIIGILATITIVAYNGITGRAKYSAALSSAEQAGKKVTIYALSNGEVLPTNLNEAGLADSGNTTYQYTRNTAIAPSGFCLTSTSGDASAHIAGTASSINNSVPGPCSGHTGIAPTTLADGSNCPAGYIIVPGSSLYGTKAFCVMKYEAKNVGGVPTSQASGLPWVSIAQTNSLIAATTACSDCHLISEAEWLTIAQNVLSVPSNWSGDSVGSGFIYSGHHDSSPANSLAASTDNDGYSGTGNSSSSGQNQRRTLTLTNGEVIWDFAGDVIEWTQGTLTGGSAGLVGEVAYATKQWSNGSLVLRNLSDNVLPAYGTPAASTWTSTTHGIGSLYSNYAEMSTRAFLRGGAWNSGTANSGVLELYLTYGPSNGATNVGFRVSQ